MRFSYLAVPLATIGGVVSALPSQAPPQNQGRPGPPPPPAWVIAMDADRNGEISASELANASEALKKLDKNEDGKLSGDELKPHPDRDGGPRRPEQLDRGRPAPGGPGGRPGRPGRFEGPNRSDGPGSIGGPAHPGFHGQRGGPGPTRVAGPTRGAASARRT